MTLDHLDALLSFVVILSGVSLLVTLFTQAVSSLLGMRGSNLRWGVESLLRELDPDLEDHARAIAEQVLQHPLVSDSNFSGFRAGLLKRWKLASAIRGDELVDVLHHLAAPAADGAAGGKIEPWREALRASLDRFELGAAERLVDQVRERREAAPAGEPPAEISIARMIRDAEALTGGIRRWFDSTMDRVSQRFAMQTRIWTVIFSFVIALALHLDSFKLLAQLSADGELRARLVAGADSLVKRAQEAPATPAAGAAEGAPPSAEPAEILAEAGQIRSLLEDELKFRLVPDPYPRSISEYWKPSWLHLAGILVSGMLLSLGSPFWFNTLKSLCNLRPVLAARADSDQTAVQAASGGGR